MRIGKFALVGITGLVINEFLLFYFTEFLTLYYVLSSFIAIEISILSNFIFNEIWTFKDREKRSFVLKRLGKYNFFSLGGMLINVALLYVLTSFFGIYYLASNIIAVIIAFSWNYLINLRFTWRYEKPSIKHTIKNPQVSIIIPTYNERENIRKLIPEIFRVLENKRLKGEIVIVDDNSPDGTGEFAEKLKGEYNVKVIHRKAKLGLSSAVMEGFRKAEGGITGVMDADFSHPPSAIPDLVKPILSKEADLTIGSRYVEGGKIKGWPLKRKIISRGASLLAKPLTDVKDPMSGFFFFSSDVIKDTVLKPDGYKIGLEIFVKGNHSKIREIPYTFVDRERGKSKLGLKEDMEYLVHLVKLYWYKVNR